MGVMARLLKQCRRPTGWFGRLLARAMNLGHSRLTAWGLGHVSVGSNFTILDIGCGGGATVRKLADMAAKGKVCGIDCSPESVAISRKTNRRLIKEGRVEIYQGSVSALPFPDNTFDLVTAVETHYFWPDLLNDMKEVLRVLKPGGTLIAIGGVYRGGRFSKRIAAWAKLADMAYQSTSELREVLVNAGYSEAQVFEDYRGGRICAVGRKPA